MAPAFSARVIIPKGTGLNAKALARAIETTLNTAARGAKRDFGHTTRTWSPKDRPKFVIVRLAYQRVVGTDSKIYQYVTRGTKPHVIRAKKGKALHFAMGGRPKTRPNWIGSNKGRQGTNWQVVSKVNHPGNAPRNFEQVIGQKCQKELPRIMQEAIDREFERSSLGGR